jgi:hypothetical protein
VHGWAQREREEGGEGEEEEAAEEEEEAEVEAEEEPPRASPVLPHLAPHEAAADPHRLASVCLPQKHDRSTTATQPLQGPRWQRSEHKWAHVLRGRRQTPPQVWGGR